MAKVEKEKGTAIPKGNMIQKKSMQRSHDAKQPLCPKDAVNRRCNTYETKYKTRQSDVAKWYAAVCSLYKAMPRRQMPVKEDAILHVASLGDAK